MRGNLAKMAATHFDKVFLLSEYEDFKNLTYKYAIAGHYNHALKAAFFAARIAYHFPIIYNFIDDEFEKLLYTISTDILKSHIKPIESRPQGKIVFYNTYIADSNQLTEQFLNFFIENECDVLFIISDRNATLLGPRILKAVEASATVELYIPDGKGTEEKIIQVYNKVASVAVSKAFLQFKPDDVLGFCVFSQLGTVERYYIDLANQHFWIGKLCSDYFIEIFKTGCLQAAERRGISKNRIIYIEMYPIVDKLPFQGFPFDRAGKIVGLSGGLLYKYLADPELRYFKEIKKLIDANPNFIFCLAGDGMPPTPIVNFIKQNKLSDRFYLLGRRSDFYELVKNSDIFFESHPVKGGLTPLFAVEHKKPIVGIANRTNTSGGLEQMLGMTNFKQGDTFEGFYEEADRLIKYKEERERNVVVLEQCRKTKYYFDKELLNILSGQVNPATIDTMGKLTYNDEKALNEYLALENAEFNYYLEKIVFTLSLLSIKQKAHTACKLFLTIRHKSTLLIVYRYVKYAIKLVKNKVVQ